MIYIQDNWCKGCGLCIDTCPKDVLEEKFMKAIVVREENCIKCGICENICPDFAIHVRSHKDE